MNTIIAILSVIVIVSFSCADEGGASSAIEKVGKSSLGKLPTTKVISITEKEVTIKIMNDTGVDLTYPGFSKQRPLLHIARFADGEWKVWRDAEWEDDGAGGDRGSNGVRRYILKNGSSVLITCPVTRNIRYYTFFVDDENKKSGAVILHEKK